MFVARLGDPLDRIHKTVMVCIGTGTGTLIIIIIIELSIVSVTKIYVFLANMAFIELCSIYPTIAITSVHTPATSHCTVRIV